MHQGNKMKLRACIKWCLITATKNRQSNKTKSVTGFTSPQEYVYSYYRDLKRTFFIRALDRYLAMWYIMTQTARPPFSSWKLLSKLSRHCTFLIHLPRLWLPLLISLANLFCFWLIANGCSQGEIHFLFPSLSELSVHMTLTIMPLWEWITIECCSFALEHSQSLSSHNLAVIDTCSIFLLKLITWYE